jgi:hypothetical protein
MTYKIFALGDLRVLLALLSSTCTQAGSLELDTRGTLDGTVPLESRRPVRMRPDQGSIASPAPRRCVLKTGVRHRSSRLTALYDRMIWIDRKFEAESFVRVPAQEM